MPVRTNTGGVKTIVESDTPRKVSKKEREETNRKIEEGYGKAREREKREAIIQSIVNPTKFLNHFINKINLQNNYFLVLLAITLISAIFGLFVAPKSIFWGIQDWVFFISCGAFICVLEWKLLRKINHLDMGNDLVFVGVRLLGFALIIIAVLFFLGFMTAFVKQPKPISTNLYWIAGFLFGFLGIFCLFRTVRRYTVVGIWR